VQCASPWESAFKDRVYVEQWWELERCRCGEGRGVAGAFLSQAFNACDCSPASMDPELARECEVPLHVLLDMFHSLSTHSSLHAVQKSKC
jgi:hypothetical protein